MSHYYANPIQGLSCTPAVLTAAGVVLPIKHKLSRFKDPFRLDLPTVIAFAILRLTFYEVLTTDDIASINNMGVWQPVVTRELLVDSGCDGHIMGGCGGTKKSTPI